MLFTPGIVEEVENIKSKLSFLDKFTVSASKIQQLSIYEKIWKKQVENKTHWMDLSIYMTKYLNFFEILEQQSRFNLSMNIGSA